MGKSNKTPKWFKAVKKAFRSPSKERPHSPDLQDTVDADERPLSKHYDRSPVRHQEPTPHPLPSFEIITHDEASEPEHGRGQAFPQPLPTPEAVDPAIHPGDKGLENVIEEEENNHGSNGVKTAHVVGEKQQQQDDDEESINDEEEAAARIRQRFSEPLALKGLIRLQGLVRGHQVRRQAATTLQTMEAIVRVQAVFRGRRIRMSKDGRAVRSRISKRRRLSSRQGLHVDASRGGSQYNEAVIFRSEPEAYKLKRPPAYLLTQQLKRSAPKRSMLYIDCDPSHSSSGGWEWLELWSNARPWELRTVDATKGSSNSKDFIEIIPSRKNNAEYATKEVDVNTLKVKYFEDYVSNPTPAKSRSSNPTSESKKESSTKPSSSPGLFEKKEPVKPPSPAAEKKELGSKSSPMTERKEPVTKSSSPMSERKEHVSKYSSPMSEKKEPLRSAGPMAEKKEPARSSSLVAEKREPFRSARPLPEKKELNRSSSSPLSEKKESLRASSASPFSEKKEPASSRSPSSPFSDKKEPVRGSSTSSSEKKEPLRASSTSFSEKKERPSSPFSEKSEPEHVVTDWPQATRAPTPSPLPAPTSPPPPLLAPHSHRVILKPPPIELPSQQNILPAMVEEDRPTVQVSEPRTPEALKSPVREKSMPSSPAVSENSLPMPPSPQASDASLPVPETPPGLDSSGDEPSLTMEHLLLPEALSDDGDTNGELNEAVNGALNGDGHSSSCLSACNGEHQHGEDTASAKGSASDVVNGLGSNGTHQENGDSKSSAKEEKGRGESNNGDSPGPSKRPTCRYMVPTASAKAKFRSSSNPKTRAPETPESPVRTTPKRYSVGGSPTVVGSKGTDSPKTAFGTRKTSSFQNRGTPSPKAATPKEKPVRSVETGSESPARRNSLGGDKRWRT